ncbi:MAG TPA: ABC transporter substrate-binding protein [Stellaceae bacterium]|jgi:peptide/nickel transport system substrate-binding protein|nr:ABC transporter substrate-binding protein [Stellaceae bacterium]
MGPLAVPAAMADAHCHPHRPTRRQLLAATVALSATGLPRLAKAAAPAGQLTYGVHVSLAPTWFDPADTQGIITPFMVLYALHDAMVKAMPGKAQAPCLAEEWNAAKDGLSYDFTIRKGALFHNGDPVTADDVKFSYERYRGTSHDLMKSQLDAIEVLDPSHVRFKLKKPWPDFLSFYSSASGAGWIVPKKYVEKLGDDGFRKNPVGAGPYKFVSFNPGQELVLEAFEGYWRKTPSVKTLVMKVIPDEATRTAALKRGEVDIAYSIRGELAEEVQKTPGLALKPVVLQAPNWLYFPEQWDPKSPWHDVRVRQAANLAIDREGMSKALFLGHCKTTNSIIPYTFDYYWQPPAARYDPAAAKKLMADAGHAGGFDAGLFYCDSSYSNMAEVSLNNLAEIGIQVKLQPIERAGFFGGYGNKKYKRGIIQAASGAFGNAATRLAAFVVKDGAYAYGSYPDIDELYPQQADELDHEKRTGILDKMQQLVHDKAIYAPIWQLGFINAIGPRVGESSFGAIPGFAYTAPFEDLTLKG